MKNEEPYRPKDLRRVTHVIPFNDTEIIVRFDNGETKVVDLEEDMKGEMGEPLKDPKFFQQVKVAKRGVVEWPNGFDCCADELYRCGKKLL